MSSAQISEPPSASKLDLIRRFLKAAGIQNRIDSGSILDRYAFIGGAVFNAAAQGGATIGEAVALAMDALRTAYAPHRHVWQEEYESHLNWEFTEEELREIVGFLEKAVGQHFLEGRWRMDAYIGTNTEDLIEQIASEAEATLSRH